MSGTETMSPGETSIWLRAIEGDGTMPEQTAREILKWSFSKLDRVRMRSLSAKARAGELTPSDNREMDEYERVGTLISIMKSHARRRLKSTGPKNPK